MVTVQQRVLPHFCSNSEVKPEGEKARYHNSGVKNKSVQLKIKVNENWLKLIISILTSFRVKVEEPDESNI